VIASAPPSPCRNSNASLPISVSLPAPPTTWSIESTVPPVKRPGGQIDVQRGGCGSTAVRRAGSRRGSCRCRPRPLRRRCRGRGGRRGRRFRGRRQRDRHTASRRCGPGPGRPRCGTGGVFDGGDEPVGPRQEPGRADASPAPCAFSRSSPTPRKTCSSTV
jgi:hypothetical protein